jgi:hypothetical protein
MLRLAILLMTGCSLSLRLQAGATEFDHHAAVVAGVAVAGGFGGGRHAVVASVGVAQPVGVGLSLDYVQLGDLFGIRAGAVAGYDLAERTTWQARLAPLWIISRSRKDPGDGFWIFTTGVVAIGVEATVGRTRVDGEPDATSTAAGLAATLELYQLSERSFSLY